MITFPTLVLICCATTRRRVRSARPADKDDPLDRLVGVGLGAARRARGEAGRRERGYATRLVIINPSRPELFASAAVRRQKEH